ncbi:MAG: SDR family oxidoreductase [Bacteroidales bacterium]|nr:SDR family oxidoreductase [Bacteroidales bacterium]
MMYNLLKGKKGIIFGALDDKSIAWHIAERCHEEGAEFILSNTPAALRFGTLKQLAEKTGSEIVEADATNIDDLKAVFTRAMEKFGGQIDFVLHAIGMSLNVRKNRSYDDVDYNYYTKTMDISAFSFHKMLQTAYKLDAIKEWGSVVALSYVAGQRTFYRYNDMADAKALLESIARSFGYIYGRDKKVRVNTISQSPTMTTAGSGVKGIDNLMDYSDRMSPLGNATAEDCANYCVTLFSDLTKKITMQNLYNDGGFSSMGMSQKAMHVYNASLEIID